jgi:TolB-like protein
VKIKLLQVALAMGMMVPPQAMAQAADTKAAVRAAPDLPAALDHLAELIEKAIQAQQSANREKIKIAVAPFVSLGPTAHQKKLGEVTSELLVTRLASKDDIQLIERSQLNQVLEELKLSMLGLTEGSNAEQVGKLLGAEAMIVGSVSEVGDTFAIAARHVHVASGRVIFAREVRVPQASAIALSSEYIVTKSRGDAFFRSLLIPGWGQQYNNQTTKGWIFTGLAAGIGGYAIASHLMMQSSQDKYLDPAGVEPGQTNAYYTQKSVEYYDSAQSSLTQRNVALIGLGVLWGINAVDAYLSGKSASEVKVPKYQAPPAVTPSVGQSSDGEAVAFVHIGF